MNEPAITPDAITTRRHFDSQRLAWGVLLLSFAIFGLMCVTAGLGLNYFLFQSVVPLEAVVRVGRGSSGVNGQFVSTAKDLTYNDELVTAAQSQAVIFFRDPNRGNRLVATVTLKGNTELAYRRALRPRFEWSANSYTIELEEYVGDLIVFIAPDLQRDVLLSIRSREGSRSYFNSPGRYLVNASSEEMHVVNLNGDVVLIASDGQTTRHLPAGSQGAILDTSQQIDLSEGYINLLDNQDANAGGSPGPAATNVLNEDLLLSWACTNSQDELPRGDYVSELEDGRPVLRLLRAGNATKNGETRCVARSINDSNGQNVSSYDYLALQLTFKINYQSLNICGQAGSECPLTVRIDYLDTEGR
ncbi:MAG: hypothetical protein K8I60_17055, partial [Anaerolineae bacterium]|nr:hypothetical protein [Anaerolineae bacterium]